jgi:hypothetical protein
MRVKTPKKETRVQTPKNTRVKPPRKLKAKTKIQKIDKLIKLLKK